MPEADPALVELLVSNHRRFLDSLERRVARRADAEDVLQGAFVRALESASEHPLAAAILQGAEERGVDVVVADEFASRTGLGLTGTVGGRRVAVGNEALMHEVGADPIKAGSAEAVEELRRMELDVVMLTGDGRATAEAVARELGIEHVEADVRPEDKRAVVERLQREGRVVAMAGDGVNDAPAPARAQVGIAMGTGTDVAVESAGVTLARGDLRAIGRARRLSAATMRNVRQNLFSAFVYNALGVPIAAGVLYPAVGWTLSPMLAAAAMTLSSVSVITNALRLRRAAL